MDHYGMLEEFVTMVTELVPELMSYSQRAQLILGLRARVSNNVLYYSNIQCFIIELVLILAICLLSTKPVVVLTGKFKMNKRL